jgi:hypothetical protein
MGAHTWVVQLGMSTAECRWCGAQQSYATLQRSGSNTQCHATAASLQQPEHCYIYHDYAPYELRCFGCGWATMAPPSQISTLPTGPCSQIMWQPHPFAPGNQTPAQVIGGVPSTPPPTTPGVAAHAAALNGLFQQHWSVSPQALSSAPISKMFAEVATEFCDFRLKKGGGAYACSTCRFEVPYEDYAGEVRHRGYYPPRECAGPKGAASRRKACVQCGADWCEYLDQYWGTDGWAAKRCVKCRGRKAS